MTPFTREFCLPEILDIPASSTNQFLALERSNKFQTHLILRHTMQLFFTSAVSSTHVQSISSIFLSQHLSSSIIYIETHHILVLSKYFPVQWRPRWQDIVMGSGKGSHEHWQTFSLTSALSCSCWAAFPGPLKPYILFGLVSAGHREMPCSLDLPRGCSGDAFDSPN